MTKVGKRHPITNKLKDNYKEKPWGNECTRSQLTSGKVLLNYENDPLLVVDDVGKGKYIYYLVTAGYGKNR